MHQVSKQMMESEREINAGGKFPMTQIILLFLGNQFVNNLCVFLGRGGGVANVAVAKLPRVISTIVVHTDHLQCTHIQCELLHVH